MEKNIVIVGVGNAGSQVALLAENTYSTLMDSVYINSSDSDLSMVTSSSNFKYKIGEKNKIEGSGKDRNKMKEYLFQEADKILNDETFRSIISRKKYCFIVASAAGGTGSGAAPVLMELLRTVFPNTNFILVVILPQIHASLLEQANTVEFLDELYNELSETTYMVYDNETTADKSPTEGLDIVNENIVEDIRVLTCVDNFPTPYDSIDEADMETIITTPGRLLVVRVKKGITEKALEDNQADEFIIKAIKQSCHTETDRNKKVTRMGIITFFNEAVNKLYTSNLDKVGEFIGTPIERFNHHAINEKGELHNFLYMIASGLSPINDRVKKLKDRIDNLKNALANDESSKYILTGENITGDVMSLRKRPIKKDSPPDKESLMPIFNRFMKKKI